MLPDNTVARLNGRPLEVPEPGGQDYVFKERTLTLDQPQDATLRLGQQVAVRFSVSMDQFIGVRRCEGLSACVSEVLDEQSWNVNLRP